MAKNKSSFRDAIVKEEEEVDCKAYTHAPYIMVGLRQTTIYKHLQPLRL